jgi:hypothetical protein
MNAWAIVAVFLVIFIAWTYKDNRSKIEDLRLKAENVTAERSLLIKKMNRLSLEAQSMKDEHATAMATLKKTNDAALQKMVVGIATLRKKKDAEIQKAVNDMKSVGKLVFKLKQDIHDMTLKLAKQAEEQKGVGLASTTRELGMLNDVFAVNFGFSLPKHINKSIQELRNINVRTLKKLRSRACDSPEQFYHTLTGFGNKLSERDKRGLCEYSKSSRELGSLLRKKLKSMLLDGDVISIAWDYSYVMEVLMSYVIQRACVNDLFDVNKFVNIANAIYSSLCTDNQWVNMAVGTMSFGVEKVLDIAGDDKINNHVQYMPPSRVRPTLSQKQYPTSSNKYVFTSHEKAGINSKKNREMKLTSGTVDGMVLVNSAKKNHEMVLVNSAKKNHEMAFMNAAKKSYEMALMNAAKKKP